MHVCVSVCLCRGARGRGGGRVCTPNVCVGCVERGWGGSTCPWSSGCSPLRGQLWHSVHFYLLSIEGRQTVLLVRMCNPREVTNMLLRDTQQTAQ